MEHPAGHSLFVDYAGQQMQVIDPASGKERMGEVFVAALGFSRHLYAEAMWSQKIADWIGSHRRAFEFFAQYLVCENLKSAVRKAHRYDPDQSNLPGPCHPLQAGGSAYPGGSTSG